MMIKPKVWEDDFYFVLPEKYKFFYGYVVEGVLVRHKRTRENYIFIDNTNMYETLPNKIELPFDYEFSNFRDDPFHLYFSSISTGETETLFRYVLLDQEYGWKKQNCLVFPVNFIKNGHFEIIDEDEEIISQESFIEYHDDFVFDSDDNLVWSEDPEYYKILGTIPPWEREDYDPYDPYYPEGEGEDEVVTKELAIFIDTSWQRSFVSKIIYYSASYLSNLFYGGKYKDIKPLIESLEKIYVDHKHSLCDCPFCRVVRKSSYQKDFIDKVNRALKEHILHDKNENGLFCYIENKLIQNSNRNSVDKFILGLAKGYILYGADWIADLVRREVYRFLNALEGDKFYFASLLKVEKIDKRVKQQMIEIREIQNFGYVTHSNNQALQEILGFDSLKSRFCYIFGINENDIKSMSEWDFKRVLLVPVNSYYDYYFNSSEDIRLLIYILSGDNEFRELFEIENNSDSDQDILF